VLFVGHRHQPGLQMHLNLRQQRIRLAGVSAGMIPVVVGMIPVVAEMIAAAVGNIDLVAVFGVVNICGKRLMRYLD